MEHKVLEQLREALRRHVAPRHSTLLAANVAARVASTDRRHRSRRRGIRRCIGAPTALALYDINIAELVGERDRLLARTSWKPIPKARLALCALLVVLWVTGPSAKFAQGQAPDRLSLQELATEFTDPLTTLPQVLLKDAYSPANFGTHVQTNQAILRAIIPRIPRFSLFPLIQLIRPTFSLVTVPSATGGTRTEFGDTQLFDLAVLPWPGEKTGLRIGLGPTFVFSDRDLQERRPRGMAGGPGTSRLLKNSCLIRSPDHCA